jgi:tetratricopeptide (TPR) repeat protein
MIAQPDPLGEFQRRIGTSVEVTPGASAELILDIVDAQTAKLLRLCAIPHRFDAEVVQILSPELEHSEIQHRCKEFSRLSFVSADTDGWALHDGVRQHFFSQWLKPPFAREFAEASARLATFFKMRMGRSYGEPSETARRSYMFHLLGADQEAGFREFELLVRRARHNRSYSDCNQLIRLMHEYDGFLSSRYRLWLTYHEAKLFADLRDLEKAETGYQSMLSDPDSMPEQRVAAYVRLGYVYNERRNWDDAIRCYEKGLALAESSGSMLPRILHDLGAAYRDKGELERAEALLNRSLELAQEQHNLSSLGLAYNSLGMVALKRRDIGTAVHAFDKSLDALMQNKELFRTAQVYNNLGLAYADVPDWERSDEYFRKSLEIKSKAGDTLGQASALNNLARVQGARGDLKAAIASLTKAIGLFTEMRDPYNAALVKHNRGKLFRRTNEPDLARNDFVEAMEALQNLGRPAEAAKVFNDLAYVTDISAGRTWAVIVLLAVLFILAIVFMFMDFGFFDTLRLLQELSNF